MLLGVLYSILHLLLDLADVRLRVQPSLTFADRTVVEYIEETSGAGVGRVR